MLYKLLDTGQGLLENRTPIFYDLEGDIELPFLLPSDGRYFGLFTNMTGQRKQLKVEFKENILTVPQEFKLPGLYLLTVIKIDESGKVIKSWDCEPLRIRSLDRDLRNEFEVTGAAAEEDTRTILKQTLEELIAIKKLLEDCISKQDLEDYKKLNEEQLGEAIDKFNELSAEVESIKGGL